MAYYTLLVRDNNKDYWITAFGDYDKETVEFERQDYIESYHGFYNKKNTKIVKTRTARQSEIDNVLKKLNHVTR